MPTENSTESNNQSQPGTGAAPLPGSPGATENSNSGSNAGAGLPAGQPGNSPGPLPHGPAAGNSPTTAAGPNFGQVLTAIQAMPEQIVHAMREATQPAQAPRAAAPAEQSQSAANGAQSAAQSGSQGGSREPGRKSLAEWWFGR